MPIEIKVTADTAAEAMKLAFDMATQYIQFGAQPKPAPLVNDKTPEPLPEVEEEKQEVLPPAEEKKKGKPAKAVVKETPPAKPEDPKEKLRALKDDGGTVEPTIDGCRVIAKRLMFLDGEEGEAGGTDEVVALLQKLGVTHIKQLPEERYPDFIKECETVIEAKTPKMPAAKKATSIF